MIRIRLTNKERHHLEKLREGSVSEHSEKALMVLLNHEGKSPIEIGAILRRNPHTVRDWLKRYIVNGVEGFRRKASPGRPAVVRNASKGIIQGIIEKCPSDYGFHSNYWTAQLIVEYLKENKGIHSSIDTVKRTLKQLGYTFKRPTKSVTEDTLSEEEKREKVQKMIEEIQPIIDDKSCEIFSVDESHFTTDPFIIRGWIKRGEKKTPFAIQTRKKNPVWCITYENKAYLFQKRTYRK